MHANAPANKGGIDTRQATFGVVLFIRNSRTERFKAAAEPMEVQAKAQYEKNLELLHTKQEEAWQNFYKLKAADESAWAQLKAHMDKAGGELKDAVERMTTIFKK